MASVTIEHVSASSALRLGDAAARLGAAFGKWRERRRTYRQLARLDERMLKDVGLSRHDVRMFRSAGWRA